MTGLERKALQMRDEYRKAHNGQEPKFANIEMVWKDDVENNDKHFIKDMVALKEFDIDTVDDDAILFYFGDFSQFLSTLANIDDLDEKYNYEDYAYLAGAGEFTIVDIFEFE